MLKISQKLKKILGSFAKKADDYQIKLTFAEAGVYETGEEIVENFKIQEKIQEKQILLVVGNKGTFSQDIMSYALDMAERMSYEILALSTSDLSCDTFSLFPDSKRKMCQEFNTLAEENSKIFAKQAENFEIKFNHKIVYSDVDNAIDNINRKMGGITFVVNEQFDESTLSERKESRPENRLFVYSVV